MIHVKSSLRCTPEAQLPIYWVPVLGSLYELKMSITQEPTIWVPGLLRLEQVKVPIQQYSALCYLTTKPKPLKASSWNCVRSALRHFSSEMLLIPTIRQQLKPPRVWQFLILRPYSSRVQHVLHRHSFPERGTYMW